MRCVLLEHRLTDGSFHYDWMLDLAGEPAALATFRVTGRIDLLGEGGFQAERIGDHRRDYLEYEGPLSGGRGAVRRVAAGSGRVESTGDSHLAVLVNWGVGQMRFEGRGNEACWRFTAMKAVDGEEGNRG